MRLLRLAAYYYPEKVASSHLRDDKNEAFADNGILSTVIAPVPTRGIDEKTRKEFSKKFYETTNNGTVTIKRFPLMQEGKNSVLRAVRYVLCNIKTYKAAIKETDADAVYAGSTPPTQGYMAGLVAKKLSKKCGRKVPFVFCLQDVFPDSLVNAGMTKKGSLLWKIGRKIEDKTYKSADKIIVISESMKQNILEKGVPENKTELIPNWIDLDGVKPIERTENKLITQYGFDKDKFIVVYAGNFGEIQGADIVLEAAKILKDNTDIVFAVFGGGSRYASACETAKQLNNVVINKLLPVERAGEVYSLGDVAIITCKKGTGNAGMPSKTWSIMACNTPIIAAFDTDSELAKLLEDTNAGVCTEPENPVALADEILRAYTEKTGKNNTRTYLKEHNSKEVCLAKTVNVIKNLVAEE